MNYTKELERLHGPSDKVNKELDTKDNNMVEEFANKGQKHPDDKNLFQEQQFQRNDTIQESVSIQ